MVVDLSGRLNRFQLTNVVKEAAFWDQFSTTAFERESNRLAGRAGLSTARRAVESYLAGCAGTRSALEDRMIRLVELGSFRLPDEAGVPIGPHEVDLVWFDLSVIVEVDGPGHNKPNSRKKDPARDADLQRSGFTVVRFTKSEIDFEPMRILGKLDKLLG
jgi:very-short-patch-repair endonuclease